MSECTPNLLKLFVEQQSLAVAVDHDEDVLAHIALAKDPLATAQLMELRRRNDLSQRFFVEVHFFEKSQFF